MTALDFTKHKFFLSVSSAVLALFYTLPFLLKISYWGVRDWDLFTTIAAVPVGSILEYGQFPFWNPYLAGGNILFHHPEVAILSPFMLLHVIFGAVVGLKLQVLICYFIGLYGSSKLAEQLGMSRPASLLVAVGYFGSVHFALHFAEGHIPFTHFCFLPWFLYFLFRSEEKRWSVLWAGFSLALMILGNGAAVPMLYSLTLAGLLFALISVADKTIVKLWRLVQAVVVGVGLAAVKLVPMVVYLYQNKWPGAPEESIPVSALGSIFFGLKHSLYEQNLPNQAWDWHEYGAYISPLLVILAVAAVVITWRRHWYWTVLALFFLFLGLGDFGWFSPWSLLSHLPGFSSSRCTGRAFQFVILSTAVLGGFGFDSLRRHFVDSPRRLWVNSALYLSVAVIIATNLILAWPIMSDAFKQAPESVKRSETFVQVVDERPQAYKNYLANRGSLVTPWLSATHPSRGLVDVANVPHPEHVLSGKIDSVTRHYTPNRIEYEFTATQPGAMVIGMGFDRGWYTEDGRALTEQQGLLSFRFGEGRQRVVMVYRPPYFYHGLVVSLIFLIGALVILSYWRRPVSTRSAV